MFAGCSCVFFVFLWVMGVAVCVWTLGLLRLVTLGFLAVVWCEKC